MYTIQYSNKFRKDLKRAIKRGYDISLLEKVIELLQKEGTLPEQYKPHKFSRKYAGLNECHIKHDSILVCDQNDKD